MSGPWRYTDEHGVEQAVGTDDLRTALSSGKMQPATLVWREGMDKQPAFTVAELASAAIAAARRSVPPGGNASARRSTPPPLPARRPPSRPVLQTLTGIEPLEEAVNGSPNEVAPPPPSSAEAIDIEEATSSRGADVTGLVDDDSWDDATDVIPRAPNIPLDVLRLASPKPLIPTPPPPGQQPRPEPPRRPTDIGLGKQGLSTKTSSNQPTVGQPTAQPQTAGRSKPPPPPQRKRSEAPPPPSRLNKTLEIGLAKTSSPSIRTPPASTRKPIVVGEGSPPSARPRPPIPANRRTAKMGAPPAQPTAQVPSRPPPPHHPSKPPPRPVSARPPAPSGDLAAAPNADTLTAPTIPGSTPDAPQPASAAPVAASAAAASTAAAAPAEAAPAASSAATVPAAYDFAPPAKKDTSQTPTTPKVTPAPSTTADKQDTKGGAKLPRPGSLAHEKTLPVAPAVTAKAENGARKTASISSAEKAVRKPLSIEKTEVMIREALVAQADLPRESSPTLEMQLSDHTEAAAIDPAPPESKRLKETARAQTPAKEEPTQPLAEAQRKVSSRPPENTDGTAVTEDEDLEDELPKKPRSALEVPMSAVLAVSAAWVIGLVTFFFVGRVSGFKSAGELPEAREGIADVFRDPEVVPPTPAETTAPAASSEPKPCWVTRQPRKWAKAASKSVPFAMRARDSMIDLGFALDDNKAAGLRIDPKAGTAETVFSQDTKDPINSVSPLANGDGFYVGAQSDRTLLPVDAATPFFLVLDKTSVGAADAPDQTVEPLWKLEGESETAAEQVLRVGDAFMLTFRRGNDVYAGYFGADKKAKGELAVVSNKESEAKNGKPRSGTNGTEVATVYAVENIEKKGDAEEKIWRINLAKSAVMSTPTSATTIELPPNGPGGDAIAPDIIGLSDGRWLLMWTEGTSGARAIRAQTYDKTLTPIGDPIALSPPAGSFGQAVLGVSGAYTTVAFLQAGDEGFEMWGAVLQCGP
ncbi:MAG: hypothetical protein HOW73_13310 [Polyangiaceae bacterium]|nr:hypothetical protein [Polyangiaceae bacterium]